MIVLFLLHNFRVSLKSEQNYRRHRVSRWPSLGHLHIFTINQGLSIGHQQMLEERTLFPSYMSVVRLKMSRGCALCVTAMKISDWKTIKLLSACHGPSFNVRRARSIYPKLSYECYFTGRDSSHLTRAILHRKKADFEPSESREC